MKEKKIFFVICPKCKQKTSSQSHYKPFCSERCKTTDLAKWSDGSYSLEEESIFSIFNGNEAE